MNKQSDRRRIWGRLPAPARAHLQERRARFYRYRTAIFIGAWHPSRAAALHEAVRDDVASWTSRARDEVEWHVDGEIEESDSPGHPGA